MQVVNVHLCRSRRTSVFSSSLFSNGLITAGIVAEMAFVRRHLVGHDVVAFRTDPAALGTTARRVLTANGRDHAPVISASSRTGADRDADTRHAFSLFSRI